MLAKYVTGTIRAHGCANLLSAYVSSKSKDCVLNDHSRGVHHHVNGKKFLAITFTSFTGSGVFPFCNVVGEPQY